MCSGRTTVLSVEAPGLMKHLSVPGTRTDTWPNIPIVPWRLSIRVNVAAFSRSSASSFMLEVRLSFEWDYRGRPAYSVLARPAR